MKGVWHTTPTTCMDTHRCMQLPAAALLDIRQKQDVKSLKTRKNSWEESSAVQTSSGGDLSTMAAPPRHTSEAVWGTMPKLSSECLMHTYTLWFWAGIQAHWPKWKRRGDQYERGIYMSQSWSSASVWHNTQLPVVVNYCFDRMSLQFCRVCVRALSAARLLFISGLRLLSLSRGESGRPRQTDRVREREQGNREEKGEIIHLSAAWWNAILTEAANRSFTGLQHPESTCW